ncbi:hypothetical protein, partial [Klebsiella grimontii]|uniref:hypothetical protein n=1 Tax=Klebsiella grimontii TaxID=2058152 RepID=UPI001C49B10A
PGAVIIAKQFTNNLDYARKCMIVYLLTYKRPFSFIFVQTHASEIVYDGTYNGKEAFNSIPIHASRRS